MALSGIEVIGKIIKVSDARSGVSKRSGNEWKSQDFVIEEQGSNGFPRMCNFTVFGADRLEQFQIKVGDTVHVWLDINARPWQDRYFNDIRAYRVDHVDPNSVGMANGGYAAAPSAAPAAGPASPVSPVETPAQDASDEDSSLPF